MLFNKNIHWEFPNTETFPQALFGAMRKHDIHTGIDIYVPEGTDVYPIKSGKVINVEWFTGINSKPPTSWWNDTQAVWVQDNDGFVWVYGELMSSVSIGDTVNQETSLGQIKQVLKKDKQINSTSMLHLELYSAIPNETVVWLHEQEKPDLLLNPLDHIQKIKDNI